MWEFVLDSYTVALLNTRVNVNWIFAIEAWKLFTPNNYMYKRLFGHAPTSAEDAISTALSISSLFKMCHYWDMSVK